jgi:hypothetical protein
VIEKSVLKILRTIGCHGRFSIFCSRLARETFFAQVLPHAFRACAALPLAKQCEAREATIRWQLPFRRKHKFACAALTYRN